MKKTPAKECLSDFLKRFGKSKTLARFAQVSLDTTQRWISGETDPAGENLLRVRYFLNLCGYEVTELAELKPLIFEIGQSVAVGCTTLDEITSALGIEKNQHVLRYLRGDVNPSPERTVALERIVAEKRQILAQKLTEIKEKLTIEGLLEKKEQLSVNNVSDLREPKEIIDAFEISCRETLRLATILRQGSLEQRAAMRRQMASGSEPLLHTTWEALNLLIHEQTH